MTISANNEHVEYERSDDQLYREFLHGKLESYDELMLRYEDSLLLYLNGYLHHWQDAEDLMIEAFARILAKKPKISEGNFRAYLFKVGRNLASHHHAWRKKTEAFSLEELNIEIPDRKNPEDEMQEKTRSQVLYRCLGRTEKDVREALFLVYMEDMSYTQAAMVLGVSPKKVDNLLVKGKKLLREELEKEGFEWE